ncbi:MAG: exonuclease SbcCD subunit D [Nanoarchaeota archaeon]
MKFVHLADIHIGITYKGKEFFDWELFEKIIKEIINLSPEFVLISGDLFDKPSINPEDLLKTIELFKKLKKRDIPVFTIEGNHDYDNVHLTYYDFLSKLGLINNLSAGDRLGLLKEKYESNYINFQEINIDQKNKRYFAFAQIENKKIYGLAYIRSREMLKKLINKFYKEGDVLMLHQSISKISGVPEENCELKIEEISGLNFKYFALGHIHNSNFPNFNFNNKFILYSGSIDSYSKKEFNEILFQDKLIIKKKEKGFIYFENEPIFKKLNNKKYYSIKIFFSSLEELKKKLEKIKEFEIEKAIIELETIEKFQKEKLKEIVNYYLENKIIEIKITMPEEKEELNIEIKENNYLEELVNRFIAIKESLRDKELIKEKIKREIFEYYKEDNKMVWLFSTPSKERDEKIKEIENIKEAKKELKKEIKETKGILKFLKNN